MSTLRTSLFQIIFLLLMLPSISTAAKSKAREKAAEAKTSEAKAADLSVWDGTWDKIQKRHAEVSIINHWNVCGIKFRLRAYKDLFNCLELVEERAVKEAENVRKEKAFGARDIFVTPDHMKIRIERYEKYVSFFSNWMRVEAYVELGQLKEARTAAEISLKVLSSKLAEPEFRQVLKDLNEVCMDFGGSIPVGSSNYTLRCRNNVAGLDYDPTMIHLRVVGKLALIDAQLGRIDDSEKSIADLKKIVADQKNAKTYSILVTGFEAMARLQALLPLFTLGKYDEVVSIYEEMKDTKEYKALTGKTKLEIANVYTNSSTLSAKENFVADMLSSVIMSSIAHMSYAQSFETSLDAASNSYMYATSLSRGGRIEEAKKILDRLLANSEIRDMGSIYWSVVFERGQIALKEGKRDEAIKFFRQSTGAIEKVRSSISFEASKIGFVGNKQAVYAALFTALADSEDWTGAFEVVESAKARALVDLLAEKRDILPPASASEKVGQLLVQATQVDEGLSFTTEASQTRGVATTAREELGITVPETASLISVQDVHLSDIAARLGTNETLINYFGTGKDLYALVVNGGIVKGFKLDGDGLDVETRRFREELQSRSEQAGQTGSRLYDRLIRPLVGQIKGRVLTVTPHGVLHYLPFAALFDGTKYLVDTHSLRMMPSASSLVYLKTDKPLKQGKLLALGNPDLGDAKFDLPGAEREVLKIAGIYSASRVLVRQDASKTALKEIGNAFSILHIASHGQFNSDTPLKSGLLLAKGQELDGRLTVGDLYSMRLDMDLITLSACETGLGKVASGDDVMGLTRGFLYAGARSIVASLWQVDDEATAGLMIAFYKNLDKFGKLESLRLAQIEIRKKYPHPFFWAAFQLTGNG